jgi:glutamine synthetase
MSTINSVEELMERIRKDNVKYIRFEFCHIAGHAMGMLVPSRNCERFFRSGFPFVSASTTTTINNTVVFDEALCKTGFRNIKAMPFTNTYKVIPWLSSQRQTASVMMHQKKEDDVFYATDSRTICLAQINRLNEEYGLSLLSSIEHEFTLLDASNKPISHAGCYKLSDTICRFQDFFIRIDENLKQMGVDCERLHSEMASGQYEITARPSFGMKGADDAYWIKNGVREMAHKYQNWRASFITHLPLSGDGDDDDYNYVEDDSGAHFNHSLWFRSTKSTKKNDLNLLHFMFLLFIIMICLNDWICSHYLYGFDVIIVSIAVSVSLLFCVFQKRTKQEARKCAFYDEEQDGLSDLGLYWIGGVLKHIRGITAFCCPTTVCYETRMSSAWVSSQANWGNNNRTTIIRVKQNKNKTHYEMRLPSSMANPYLVMASIVCAGMDGIENKIMPPTETKMEMIGEEERKDGYEYEIPTSLGEALQALQDDEYIRNSLGRKFVDCYLAHKKLEIKEMEEFKKKNKKPLFYQLM